MVIGLLADSVLSPSRSDAEVWSSNVKLKTYWKKLRAVANCWSVISTWGQSRLRNDQGKRADDEKAAHA